MRRGLYRSNPIDDCDVATPSVVLTELARPRFRLVILSGRTRGQSSSASLTLINGMLPYIYIYTLKHMLEGGCLKASCRNNITENYTQNDITG